MSEKNPFPNESNTGHYWDENLRELTNPPPKWWMLGLHASWIFVLLYSIIYPTWPTLTSYTKGVIGWTQIKEYQQDIEAIEEIRGPFENRLKGMSAAAILEDQELANYAVRSARVLFGDNCAPCHGAGGAGNLGFPILADDDWLYGGTIDKIVESITSGRASEMPAFKSELSPQAIDDVTKHVLALSKGEEYGPGKEVFEAQGCVICHGFDAKGNTDIGGPNLTDGIWRFAPGTEESIRHTITYGVNDIREENTRKVQMPAFKAKLNEAEVNKLAVYVHQLGGGQ